MISTNSQLKVEQSIEKCINELDKIYEGDIYQHPEYFIRYISFQIIIALITSCLNSHSLIMKYK